MSDDFEHLFFGTPKQVEREAQLKMLTVTREGRKNMEKYFYSPLKKEKHEENKTKMFGESAENRKQNDVVGIYQGVTVLATPFKVPVEGKNSGKTTKMCVWLGFSFFETLGHKNNKSRNPQNPIASIYFIAFYILL